MGHHRCRGSRSRRSGDRSEPDRDTVTSPVREDRSGLVSVADDPALRPVTEVMRPVLWCQRDTSVREAAGLMVPTASPPLSSRRETLQNPRTASPLTATFGVGSVPVRYRWSSRENHRHRAGQEIADTSRAIDALLEMVRSSVHHMLVDQCKRSPERDGTRHRHVVSRHPRTHCWSGPRSTTPTISTNFSGRAHSFDQQPSSCMTRVCHRSERAP